MSTGTDRKVSDDKPTVERGPWTQPAFIVSAAIVGILAVLLIILLIVDAFSGEEEAAVVPDDPAGVPGQVSNASASVCGLPDTADSGTIAQPPAANWTLVGTMAVPASEGIGPGETWPDQFRRCFARTPEGALFAAANVTGLGSVRALSYQTTSWYAAEGPGKETAVARAATPKSGTSRLRGQIAGFRLLNYTGTTATVDLALRFSNGAYASQIYDLVWQDGDWRFRITPDGKELLTPLEQIPDISGYIPWGGA